jgi:hypothetical protein
MCSPFTVDNFPRASWDHDKQSELVFANPETKRRGPSPIMLFPPFKTGRHLFDSDYNLSDKSESKFLFLFPPFVPYIIYSKLVGTLYTLYVFTLIFQ